MHKIRSILKPRGIVVASNTIRTGLFVFREVFDRMCRLPPHIRTIRNLLLTGYHSGGYVDFGSSEQACSAKSFDGLFMSEGFEIVGELNYYHLRRFDRAPLQRGPFDERMSRYFAWQHVGVYRKRAMAT